MYHYVERDDEVFCDIDHRHQQKPGQKPPPPVKLRPCRIRPKHTPRIPLSFQLQLGTNTDAGQQTPPPTPVKRSLPSPPFGAPLPLPLPPCSSGPAAAP